MAARTSPPRTVATRRTRPITGVGGFGKEKCGGRERRNIPPRTGNEPVAGVASETVMSIGTHLWQQTPPEECVTGVREGDAKLCRRVPSRFGFRRTTLRSRQRRRFACENSFFSVFSNCLPIVKLASDASHPTGSPKNNVMFAQKSIAFCDPDISRRFLSLSLPSRMIASNARDRSFALPLRATATLLDFTTPRA